MYEPLRDGASTPPTSAPPHASDAPEIIGGPSGTWSAHTERRQCEMTNLMTEPAVRDHGGAVGSSGPRGAPTTADAPDERPRADAGALGQDAAQQVKYALFNKELQVPDAAYEHAERLDGRPGDATGTHAARASATRAGRKSRPRARGHSYWHWQAKVGRRVTGYGRADADGCRRVTRHVCRRSLACAV